ncbi:MAG: PH domain-containing protein [Mycobacteriaceae bacterium]
MALWSAALGAVVALAVVLVTADPAGKLLFAILAVGLAACAAWGALARPRLAAGPAGLQVRGARGATLLPWGQVHRVVVVRTRRLGRDVPVLEIATVADALLVLTRLDLGAEPDDVLARLQELRRRS